MAEDNNALPANAGDSNSYPSVATEQPIAVQGFHAKVDLPVANEGLRADFIAGGFDPGSSQSAYADEMSAGVIDGSSSRITSGIQLMSHINNQLVMSRLEDVGARFTTMIQEPNGTTLLDENGESVPQFDERPVTFIGADDFTAKLYDVDGNTVDLGRNQAIMIDRGVAYLVDKNPEHDFSPLPGRGVNAEKKRGAPLLEEDLEQEENNANQYGRGGFNLFPNFTPKPGKTNSKKRAEALAAAGLLGETIANDFDAAHRLIDEIQANGGPMSPEAFESMRQFNDTMQNLGESLDQAAMSGISSRDMPQFESIKEMMDSLNEKVAGIGDFLSGGQSVLNGEMMKRMQESVRDMVSQLGAVFSRGAS